MAIGVVYQMVRFELGFAYSYRYLRAGEPPNYDQSKSLDYRFGQVERYSIELYIVRE